ncbi:YchJ family metal-binding protein [Streptomyces sp. AV19]|uniref:YchJ family protein n=1 Tax=Streptomyces sp. AV19 TaxID=2793068 RepID=UPI0024130B2C|nr:YchJ family metal-binding protein [Streptomyces sp. AV19]MDG4533262.1 YchJ family metal-binding protein [Streptomyces sp. AV19]
MPKKNRTTKRTERTGPSIAPSSPCPCGLPASYADCCGAFHGGRSSAPTAERLMRSRYSAFAVGDAAYLLRTWHSSTRPEALDLDGRVRWTGLEILATSNGTAFHAEGTVEFRAHCLLPGGVPDSQQELSRFVREDGRWVYVDGV